jgi:hypothetical protein
MPRSRPDVASRSRSTRIVWLVLLLGVATTSFGISFEAATGGRQASLTNQIVAGVTLSAGSGVAGAAISMIIASVAGHDAAEQIREMLTRTFQGRMISDDYDLDPLRKIWHQYYVTEMQGSLVWCYNRCPFDKSASVNTIVVETSYRDSGGKAHAYRTELGVCGSRGIMTSNRINGAEEPSVSVFPQMLEGFRTVHAGLLFNVSWDGHHLVSKFLMSQKKLIPGVTEGTVPEEFFARLDSAWEKGFADRNKLVTANLGSGGQPA